MTERNSRKSNETALKAISLQVYVNYIVAMLTHAILFSAATFLTGQHDFLALMLIIQGLTAVSIFPVRWYIFRDDDVELVKERFERLFQSQLRQWDTPRRKTENGAGQRLTSADGTFMVAGTAILMGLLVIGLVALFYSLQ